MKHPLHPLTLWLWAILLAIGVAAADSAILALAVVGIAAIIVWARADGSPWNKSFLFALRIGALIIVIRTLVGILIGIPIPGTVLFRIPILDLPSWMPGIRIGGAVTLERLSSSIHEGLIIATLIALFGAATSLTSPHKLLRVLPYFIYEIGITLVIATSLLPQIAASLRRIRTAQKLRGIEVRNFRSLALPLLEESLSRSLQLAASMDSRGYGVSRKRSRYRPEKWKFLDSLVIALTACLSLAMALSAG